MAQTMRKVAGPLRGRCSPYLSRPRVVRVRAVASEPRAVVSTNGTVPVTFTADWSPDSWRRKHAYQQPNYPDKAEVLKACGDIKSYPPLIFAGECRNLQERLAKAAVGEAFILQGGDCAEAFTQFTANRIRDTYRVLLQMSVVMMFGGGVPVIKLGRMAGQFAKPRWVLQQCTHAIVVWWWYRAQRQHSTMCLTAFYLVGRPTLVIAIKARVQQLFCQTKAALLQGSSRLVVCTACMLRAPALQSILAAEAHHKRPASMFLSNLAPCA
eukprot:GHRR01030123.1.p1 GENE.GHRR01030123.1~~GHRR01030123.1.p1  ORF type:complete len:268 (+),score=36.09 GHRR01030123.1:318-1121(+)